MESTEHAAYMIVLDDGTSKKVDLEKRYPMSGEEVSIGHSEDAGICLPHAGLKPIHAKIFFNQGDWHLRDLTESLQISVNDGIVTHWMFTEDGDTIDLGKAKLRFFLGNSADSSYAQMLYDRSIRDGLTQVYNRRYFDQKVADELEQTSKQGLPLSLVLIDLDKFHDINENHGHSGGDAVLKEVVARMSSHLRKERDTLCRWGGEEFAILLPGASSEQAFEVADRIRAAVEKKPVLFESREIPVTFSAGIFTTYQSIPILRFTQTADEKLKMAKRLGRNQVIR